MKPIRVILVDDHPVVRNGIRGLLDSAKDIVLAGEADNGEAAINQVKNVPADILLLDMELPDKPGTEVAKWVKENYPTLKILSLSAHDDSTYVREVLELGASGYLLKEEAPGAILEAIRGVANGQKGWVSHGIAAEMSNWIQTGHQGVKALTGRELETLRLLVQGKTNQAIANDLSISEKTVEKHIKSIFGKLEVNSRVEAAVAAVKSGIVKE